MAQASFTERGAHEKGFGEVFRREILPIIERHEAERKTAAQAALRWIVVTVVIAVAVTVFLFAVGIWNFAIFAGIVGLMIAFGIKTSHEKKWQAGLTAEVMPIACRFLGELEYGRQAINPSIFRELGLVGSYSRATLEDPATGTHSGLSYALTEARLTERRSSGKGGSKTVTIFRGILMRIELATDAPTIFFARDHGSVGNWFADTFSSHRRRRTKIEVEDAEFESTYETFADDAEAARAFITPRLTQGLMLVARAETGHDYVAAALSGKNLYLAIPRKQDFLTLGSLFTPLHVAERDFHELLHDLTLPRRVIDALRGEG